MHSFHTRKEMTRAFLLSYLTNVGRSPHVCVWEQQAGFGTSHSLHLSRPMKGSGQVKFEMAIQYYF